MSHLTLLFGFGFSASVSRMATPVQINLYFQHLISTHQEDHQTGTGVNRVRLDGKC
jgi:hypothetical protein